MQKGDAGSVYGAPFLAFDHMSITSCRLPCLLCLMQVSSRLSQLWDMLLHAACAGQGLAHVRTRQFLSVNAIHLLIVVVRLRKHVIIAAVTPLQGPAVFGCMLDRLQECLMPCDCSTMVALCIEFIPTSSSCISIFAFIFLLPCVPSATSKGPHLPHKRHRAFVVLQGAQHLFYGLRRH